MNTKTKKNWKLQIIQTGDKIGEYETLAEARTDMDGEGDCEIVLIDAAGEQVYYNGYQVSTNIMSDEEMQEIYNRLSRLAAMVAAKKQPDTWIETGTVDAENNAEFVKYENGEMWYTIEGWNDRVTAEYAFSLILPETNADKMRGELAPLFNQYSGQLYPQPAFISIAPETKSVNADWNGEIGNAVPTMVWNSRVIRVTVQPNIRGTVLADYLESIEFIDLVNRVIAGYKEAWNGNNTVGKLTNAAREALERIERTIPTGESDEVNYYEVGDYLDEVTTRWPRKNPTEVTITLGNQDQEIVITKKTTQEQIAAYASQIEKIAESDGVIFQDDVSEWLQGLRAGVDGE